jgi:hypothetical protein
MRIPPTPLSPTEQAVLDRLDQRYDPEDTVAHEIAIEQLTAVGFDAPTARECIKQLALTGYLYDGPAGLRLTPRTEDWPASSPAGSKPEDSTSRGELYDSHV